jgi:AraC-like DNA-binding protein
MNWQDVRFSIPLESQPTILQIGESTHGYSPEERYLLPDVWCFHMYRYEATVEIDGSSLPIRPGFVGITPPGARSRYRFFGNSPHLYAHFSLAPVGTQFQVPAMSDMGEKFASMIAGFQEAISYWPFSHRRSEAKLWDLLWQITDPPDLNLSLISAHRGVQQAMLYIDSHLHEEIGISDLAKRNDLSQSHFTRLFHQAAGLSPLQYIQHKRISQARHLLIYSSLPIKTIAGSIGISDIQRFNKLIRLKLGQSPRKFREEEHNKLIKYNNEE